MQLFKFKKEHVIGMALTLSVFAAFTLIYTKTTLLEGMERGGVDFRFFLRDPSEKSIKLEDGVRMSRINPRARKDIVILGIDENTIREFTAKKIIWPYSWDVHARFLRYVSTGMPLAVFFDIMFLDNKPHEDALARAISGAGNVYLDYPFETEDVEVDYSDQKERTAILDNMRFPADPDDKHPDLVEEAVPPTPKLSRASRGIGFANIFPNPRDNVNRTVPLVLKYKGHYYPNIDLLLVMHYYGIGKNDVEIKMGKYIKLKNLPVEKMARPDQKREIIIPINSYGFMDINFIGGPGSFQHYPFSLFCRDGSMTGNSSIKDKIILVAAYASTGIATDEKKSPYGATFGIEHHANALNTILNQDFLYRLNELQNIILFLVIALILGLVLPRVSIISSLVFTFLFIILFIIGSYFIFDFASVITAFATPTIMIGASFTLMVTYRVLTEQQEKKYIRQTFSKFVSKSVVDDLLKHPDKLKLGGDKKILTVLFSDIRGFTSISEKLTPEKLVEHLNEYLQSMTDIVIKYNGTLDKYVGDEIMAFWGAPIPQDDHAALACSAALEMMKELRRLNDEWIKIGKPSLNIGIGLNSGDMVVGNMGSSSRMDYTLMGDNVNLGARLEGTNKIYRTNIIISEYTYEQVRDRFVVRELDLIRVKGKELPVKIYELIDYKS
ncbi:MAG: adenylate/guanylate cyclase domain-containing protein [Spirochaetes bacterium]|jgi:adenylate cyclase|nr:adenylate/guanylate cyclase domain-containing protein [Spirochaetota bacterium]